MIRKIVIPKGKRHKAMCDKIALMFFDGNYRERPKAQSIFSFAKTKPSDSQIRIYLSDVDKQRDYNF